MELTDVGLLGLVTVSFVLEAIVGFGSTVVVVSNSAAQPRRFTVQAPGRRVGYTLPAGSVVTLVW